ncbi:MAG: YdcF family protein [Alphaproteobacteria bacterium]|nr:MAG: YdcF family protein [Alphaproteobacteria bacterium]
MKTLFLSMLMPTGLVLVSIAFLAVIIWRKRYVAFAGYANWLVGWLSAIFLLAYVTATPWFGLLLIGMLSSQVEGRVLDNPQDADAIVVLTAGMVNAGPVGWVPKADGIHRLAVGYELQRMINLRLPVIVSGGHTKGGQNPSEANVTASFFARQRTEVTPTELEEVSTDTYESAMQLAPVLGKRGARNVLLVTDEAHMLRALATYRARGIDAIPAPALSLPIDLGVRMYLPSAYGIGLVSEALYEIFGLTGYLISGKISFDDLQYRE